MAFSGGVKLGDLDDFISPSQDCVKPLIEAAQGGPAKLDSAHDAAALEPEPAALVQKPNLIKSKQSGSDPKAQIGQVSLSDCLACSGCVTSAETVLLQEQSGEEFIRRTKETPLTVVTVSSEARTSLAAHFSTSPLETLQRVTSVLQQLGADYVLESGAAEAIALLEGRAEFFDRYKASKGPAKTDGVLPLLTSHCPGWTCYAEKVVDPKVMPHLAPLRPPQEIQGRLVKCMLLERHNQRSFFRWWRCRNPLFAAEALWWLRSSAAVSAKPFVALSPQDVYHVSVQPCFDRKIEAARPQFEIEAGSGHREVDTVLTTTELLSLIAESQWAASATAPVEKTFPAVPVYSLQGEALTDVLLGSLADRGPSPLTCPSQQNAGSGGFIEHVFRSAAQDIFQAAPVGPLEFQTKQNEDMKEVVLKDASTDKVLLRFVSAYGFRNIQNVIKKVTKQGRNPITECGHFVEIMACPGGCLNGGGQIPAPKVEGAQKLSQAAQRSRLTELDSLLHSGTGVAVVPPSEHPLVLPIYRHICGSKQDGALDSYVASSEAKGWLSAKWSSLKVDSEGNEVIGTSALKW
mmetsp:Transcript_52335/g.124936  ORF Transcript_52335/g.124936 Transcript_52335/m.124936 type:complete len:575 (+) Transcript_52335:71-1795(+)